MNHCCGCAHEVHATAPLKRGDGLFATLFKLMMLYIVLVFGAGTLVNTGHPVAVEVGKLVQVVTFIDPAIDWAQSNQWHKVATGLRVLANGAPIA